MKKIEAIIKLSKLHEVQEALEELGFEGMAVCEVKGFGRENRHTETYRGSDYTVNFLPKIKIDLVVGDQNADAAVKIIIQFAKTAVLGRPERQHVDTRPPGQLGRRAAERDERVREPRPVDVHPHAVLPGDAVLLGVDAQDPALLGQLHEIVLNFSRDEAQRQGQPERVKSADYRGLTGWTFGGSEAHVLIDGRLLMTNKPDALKPALDLSLEPGAALATLPAYQAVAEFLMSRS